MSGELTRRQELLRRAGNFASLRDYDRARAAGADLPPLPSLLLVCDEFTELLTAKPDFIDLFVQIGRIGRSIGVHLLLATQRLEEGRLRGLETNLSYRIALRTFTAHESRMTLGGAADAAELPSTPGHGYLRVGTGRPAAVQGGLLLRAVPRSPRRRPAGPPAADAGLHRPGRTGRDAAPAEPGAEPARDPRRPQPHGRHRRPAAPDRAAGPPGVAAAAGRAAEPGRAARRGWPLSTAAG